MSNYYYAGLDDTTAADALVDPTAAVDDLTATTAVTEDAAATLAAQQAAAALAQQQLLAAQVALPHHHHLHMWQRLNGTTFRTRIGTWQDIKAQKLAAMGRLIRVSGAVMTGYAGDLQYRVVNPHGALMRYRDGSLMQNAKPVPPGTIVYGTPRGDGYIVEVSSGGLAGWLNALDLEQLTSADPSPVLASGEFAGAEGDPIGPLMPATGCPSGTEWNEWYGKCVPHIPAPPPPPVSTTHASGEYVGDGMMPATGCPAGTYWSDYYGKCVANIPAPPPALPDTFAQWQQQHHTSGDFAGYGWEVAGAPAPLPPEHAQNPNAPPQEQQAPAASSQHPAVASNAAPAAHAAANAADANAHAQAAIAAAAHPAAQGSGAENHAAQATNHATQATYHAHQAAHAVDPHESFAHAHQAGQHAHMARRHASHVRREGYNRGWNRGVEHHGLFQDLFGHPTHHAHGFSRAYHAHPEWHGYGHPAWRGGVNPYYMNHRAECAGRSHPRGLLGWLFGGRRRYCAIERIVHPEGWLTYRVTPSGLQEGTLLDDDQTQANQQYETQTGQAAPTADAGPLPGSDQKAAGAIEPDHAADDDTAGDEGGTDDASDSATTATTTTTDSTSAVAAVKGLFTGWSQEGLLLQAQDDAELGGGGGWPHHHHHHHHHEGMQGMPGMMPGMQGMPGMPMQGGWQGGGAGAGMHPGGIVPPCTAHDISLGRQAQGLCR